MSRERQCRNRRPKPKGNSPVGYGRPPVEHRFKPGQSGNPKGRPKGAKSPGTILREILNRKIEIRQDGRVRKITVFQAILLKQAEDAIKGNSRSAAFIMNQLRLADGSPAEAQDVSPEDQDIIDTYLRENDLLPTKQEKE